jgi:hypothetical protein
MRLASTKLRLIFLLGVVLVSSLFLGGRYGSQGILYFKIRRTLPYSDKQGKLSSVPHPLDLSSVSAAESTILSYFGWSFEAPWQEVVEERNEERWAEVRFKSGQTIKIFNPDELYAHDDIINTRSVADSSVWKMALEKGFPKSKYEQLKAVFSATPTQLSPFQSKAQFARTFVLISQKGLYFEHIPYRPEILTFEKPDLRGFEASGLSEGMEDTDIPSTKACIAWRAIAEDRYCMQPKR